MTRGQQAKANREFKAMMDRAITEIYANASTPDRMMVSTDFKAAFDNEIRMYP